MVNFTNDSSSLITKYVSKHLKEIIGEPIDKEFLNDVDKSIIEAGLKEKADILLNREIKSVGEYARARKACDRLKEIIEDITIWKLGKYNEELLQIKEVLEDTDSMYISRIDLYRSLMNLPKFKKLGEDEKIRIAMQIGSLDFRELQ